MSQVYSNLTRRCAGASHCRLKGWSTTTAVALFILMNNMQGVFPAGNSTDRKHWRKDSPGRIDNRAEPTLVPWVAEAFKEDVKSAQWVIVVTWYAICQRTQHSTVWDKKVPQEPADLPTAFSLELSTFIFQSTNCILVRPIV